MGRGDEAFCAGALVIRSAMQAKSRQDFIREVTPSQGFTSTAAEFSTGVVGSRILISMFFATFGRFFFAGFAV